MMRYLLATAAVLSAGAASAGTISRTEQPVIVLFERSGPTGYYVEGSLSWAKPDVSGIDSGGNSTGQVGSENWLLGAGIKKDFSDKWSAALVFDEPFGADLDYRDSSLIYGGTSASVDALALTALARYKFNQNFSVHGGLRLARFGADVSLDGTNFTPISGYSFEGDDAWGVGGVVGVAYEKPEIAARVILTYSSEISFDLDTKETFPAALAVFDSGSTTEVVVPQSVNLDFQTGVAKGTLVFGQIRWVNWDGFEVRPDSLDALTGLPLTFKDYNVTHYKLGIGRQFNPTWAGALQINYTPDENNLGRILDVVDGNKGLSASATYTAPSGVRVTGAAGYVWFGDSTLQTGQPPNLNSAKFADNSGLALLLKVQYSF